MTISKAKWMEYAFHDGTMVATCHRESNIIHYVWEWRHKTNSPSSYTMFVLSYPQWLSPGRCINLKAKELLLDHGRPLAESMVIWCRSLGRQVYIKDASNIATPTVIIGEPKQYMLENDLLKS